MTEQSTLQKSGRNPGGDDVWMSVGAIVFSSSVILNLAGRDSLDRLTEVIAIVAFSVALPFLMVRLWSFKMYEGAILDRPEMLWVWGLAVLAISAGTVAFLWDINLYAGIGIIIAAVIALGLGSRFMRFAHGPKRR